MLKYLYPSALTQRLIKLPLVLLLGALMSLWLFKIPRALLYKGLSVPSYPSNCAGGTEKILLTFVLVDSQKFKTHDLMFSNSRIVLRL